MSSKSQNHYLDVLHAINNVVRDMRPDLSMTDIESGLLKALRTVFPEMPIKGCWYHFMTVSVRKVLMSYSYMILYHCLRILRLKLTKIEALLKYCCSWMKELIM